MLGLPVAALVLLVLGGAAAAPLAYRRWPRAACAGACVLLLAATGALAAQLGTIAAGGVVTSASAWVPALAVTAAFRLDGLALVFALLITGIGALVVAYAPAYVGWAPRGGRLLGLLLAFAGAMLGLVLADDAITLFVFWELTSISSFFLIAFDDRAAEARAKARQALLVTSAGGLALLVGLVLAAVASTGGASLALSTLDGARLQAHPWYPLIVALVAAGAFTKSAQVPFHFWLPGAMVAPSPVSAYLHSATMVNAGVFLLARLHPTLGGTALWVGLLGSIGAVTLLAGGVLAVVQRDLKRVLAYSTIAVLGALTLLVGLGSDAAIGALILLVLAHGAYKAALFLVAGNLAHQRGTRDPFVGGAARELPITAGAAVIAAASMAGLPPLFGFVAKDALLVAVLAGPASAALVGLALVAAVALVGAAWIAGVAPFFGRAAGARRWNEAPPLMLVGPVVLALTGAVLGAAPSLLAPLVAPAAAAVAGHPVTVELALWHGAGGLYGAALGLGLASFVLGSLGYRAIARRLDTVSRVRRALDRVAAARVYDAAMAGLQAGAERVTAVVQHGRLAGYVAVAVATTVVVVAAPLVVAPTGPWSTDVDLRIHEWMLVVIGVAGAIAAAALRDRLASVAALSATGLAITFLFALFSGPDLAITQLTVETMMVILLVLVFRRMPAAALRRPRVRAGVARTVLAGSAGAAMTILLVLAAAPSPFPGDASRAHVALAPTQHSENVVNAILVNFRAIDTLGEVTVLAIAGIGVLSLLAAWRRPRGGA